MRWVTFCRSWRIKLLLLCLFLMVFLCCVKWFYLDLSLDREQCVGAECDSRLAALQSSLEHPVILPQEEVAPKKPTKPHVLLPVPPQELPAQGQSTQVQSPRIQVQSPGIQQPQAQSPQIQVQPPRIQQPQIEPTLSPQPPQVQPSLIRPPRDVIPQPPYHQAPPLPAQFRNLSLTEVREVEKFVFFIGYGRSGHSIVGSIMDAHPNVVIAHEYYLFDKLTDANHYQTIQTKSNLFDELYWSSYHSARTGWRSDRTTKKGYNLNLNGTWQGQFERLKVIGDKTGGSTVMIYHNSRYMFKAVLRRLKKIAGVPYLVIHVVRNPYDMIATTALYQASDDPNHAKVKANFTAKFKQLSFLEMATNLVLTKAAGVQAMVRDCQLTVLEIHLEDLISSPSNVIHRMCKFLGVPCADEYVRACQDKLFPHISRSRDLVAWPGKIRGKVEMAIQQFPFFNRYSFEVT